MQDNQQLISKEYKKLNEDLHKTRGGYGTGGAFWAGLIWTIALKTNSKILIDYGAGKRTLEKSNLNRHMRIFSYDPCIPEISARPSVTDMVVCTDVLEHIEPKCLESVLYDIDFLFSKSAFISIATVKGDKLLADGRDNHLIVRDKDWWLKQFPLIWKINILGEDKEKFWFEATK